MFCVHSEFSAAPALLQAPEHGHAIPWRIGIHIVVPVTVDGLHWKGTVKFDLKAFDENLHYSLCGVSNRQTLENFRRLSRRGTEAKGVFLVASTLLVPG